MRLQAGQHVPRINKRPKRNTNTPRNMQATRTETNRQIKKQGGKQVDRTPYGPWCPLLKVSTLYRRWSFFFTAGTVAATAAAAAAVGDCRSHIHSPSVVADTTRPLPSVTAVAAFCRSFFALATTAASFLAFASSSSMEVTVDHVVVEVHGRNACTSAARRYLVFQYRRLYARASSLPVLTTDLPSTEHWDIGGR